MLSKSGIEQYFLAEKNAGLLFLIIGIAGIVLTVVFFFFLKTGLYKGAAYVLIIAALVQLGVGYTIYSRSDQQRIDNVYAFDMNPGKLATNELPRMEKAMSGIRVFMWIELALLVTGIALVFKNKPHPPAGIAHSLWAGVGIALIVQALLLAGADYFAYKRGKAYLEELRAFTTPK